MADNMIIKAVESKFRIMAVHAEPYQLDDSFPQVNRMWDKSAGRLTVKYAVGKHATQINEFSVLLADIDAGKLRSLTDALEAIVEWSVDKLVNEATRDETHNSNYLDSNGRLPNG